MARPSVFVSSTVHDLRDMRSAIKYWLEEWGFEVRLNECCDFPDVLHSNSYQACLEAVSNSDYCITLIGNRVGGLYRPDEGISITRQEYRVAYEHFRRTGKPRLLPLVRREVWDAYGMCGRTQNEGLPVPWPYSPIIEQEDARAIFPFIDEVRRLDEMKEAARSGSERPTANWVHVFSGFEDVATVIKTQLRITGPLLRRALIANLIWELEYDLMCLMEKREGTLVPICGSIPGPGQLSRTQGTTPHTIVLARDEGERVVELACQCLAPSPVTFALEEAINSGMFLEYAVEKGHSVGRVQQRMIQLRNTLTGLRSWQSSVEEIIDQWKVMGLPYDREIPEGHLVRVECVWQACRFATDLAQALMRYLLSDETDSRCLEDGLELPRPASEGLREELDAQRVTRDEIRAWVSCGGVDPLHAP